jgi:DNA invertase Pin-like site-specific DNA recombinase
VRQSSLQQVPHQRERQRHPYALVERAIALGWAAERVQVIDADWGHSGQDGQRPGLRARVAAVSLRRVGVRVAYEARRLARHTADWEALLDLAAVRGTRLAATAGVSDPRTPTERLLLGRRGMLREAEWHRLPLRRAAGRQRQIARGAYRPHRPTGLVRLADGRVVTDPDLQLQRSSALVFTRFAALGACQKGLRRWRDDGLRLPRRQTSGPEAGTVVWKPPTEAAISAIRQHPAYAGAGVYSKSAKG